MSKVAIISLHETDIIINEKSGILNIFPDCSQISYYNCAENAENLINEIQNKYDKILVINRLEQLDKDYIFHFKFLSGQDAIESESSYQTFFKLSNVLEELMCNEEYNGVNTRGVYKKCIDVIQPVQYDTTSTSGGLNDTTSTSGGLYIKSEITSNIFITFNALKKLETLSLPHFSIIYNNPYEYKTAICLWGDLATWPYVKESFKNYVLKDLNTDIFLFAYKDKENIQELFNDIPLKDYVYEEKSIQENDTLKILKTLKSFNHNEIQDYNKMYCQYRSNLVRKNYQTLNKINYDLVINCNMNLLYFNNLDLNDISQNTLYTCYGIMCNNIDPYFYIGEQYVMDKIYNNFGSLASFWEKNTDEEFSIYNTIMLTIKEHNFEIGGKLINCSLQKDKNTIYKHPDKWIYVSNDQKEYFYNYLCSIISPEGASVSDIYKIQKLKDSLLK